MRTLKKGDRGDDVLEVTRVLFSLNLLDSPSFDFTNEVRSAVRAFQSFNLDQRGRPLEIDGYVGPLTRWSLFNRDQTEVFNYKPVLEDLTVLPPACYGGSELSRAALQVALDEMNAGAREIGTNNAGPFVAKYHGVSEEVAAEHKWAWCAAFASWCVKQAANDLDVAMPFKYTGGARAILRDLKSKGKEVSADDLEPGDLVIWWRESRTSWKGHIEFVHHVENGILYTVGGNRGGFPSPVANYDYVLSRMDKVLGFVRL